MKTFIAILYVAFANVLLLGQMLNRDEANPPVRNPVDRVERLSKTFPPDLVVATKDRATVTPIRSHCVYPSLDFHSQYPDNASRYQWRSPPS